MFCCVCMKLRALLACAASSAKAFRIQPIDSATASICCSCVRGAGAPSCRMRTTLHCRPDSLKYRTDGMPDPEKSSMPGSLYACSRHNCVSIYAPELLSLLKVVGHTRDLDLIQRTGAC